MAGKVFRANTSFSAPNPNGGKVHIVAGHVVPEGHWLLEGRSSLFDDVVDAAQRTANPTTSVRPVEQATAAPGEARATRRGKGDG